MRTGGAMQCWDKLYVTWSGHESLLPLPGAWRRILVIWHTTLLRPLIGNCVSTLASDWLRAGCLGGDMTPASWGHGCRVPEARHQASPEDKAVRRRRWHNMTVSQDFSADIVMKCGGAGAYQNIDINQDFRSSRLILEQIQMRVRENVYFSAAQICQW